LVSVNVFVYGLLSYVAVIVTFTGVESVEVIVDLSKVILPFPSMVTFSEVAKALELIYVTPEVRAVDP
jgi:hypothetical protein